MSSCQTGHFHHGTPFSRNSVTYIRVYPRSITVFVVFFTSWHFHLSEYQVSIDSQWRISIKAMSGPNISSNDAFLCRDDHRMWYDEEPSCVAFCLCFRMSRFAHPWGGLYEQDQVWIPEVDCINKINCELLVWIVWRRLSVKPCGGLYKQDQVWTPGVDSMNKIKCEPVGWIVQTSSSVNPWGGLHEQDQVWTQNINQHFIEIWRLVIC